MSSALAIASVTYVLKDLLNNGLIDQDVSGSVNGNVTVTALAPDRIDTATPNQCQLNLFMYRVTPNLGWSNVDLPSLNSRGDRVANPPLALDLHYLLTSYASNELHSEILLGYGMQLLHETPVLERDAVRRSLAPGSTVPGSGLPAELKNLSTSELAEQVELIKIIPESQNTEELSKLWAAFQSKYRPTAAYQATVVLIESKKPTKSSLPVQERKIYIIPFQQPVIEKIKSQSKAGEPIVEDQKILAGYNLIISGRELRGDVVQVNVGGIEVIPAAEDISNKHILFALPSELFAGIQGVQIVHQRLMGSPPVPHRGVESNIAAFILCPNIEATDISNLQDMGNNLRSADIELTVKPGIDKTQRVVLILNEFQPDTLIPPGTPPPLSYTFDAPPMALLAEPFPKEEITVPVSGVKAGVYLIRIQVDGAESPLGIDLNGKFDKPQVTIP